MRIAKWTAIILGGIVLLLVATAFVMTSVIDPNRYRGKIEAMVADLTGKPFVIEGNLAITWYPWLGIRTGAAHLDDPAIVEWQSINVAAKLWPLLHGEVVADRILLHSPHIHLRRDTQGRGNWESLGSRGAAPEPSSSTGTATNHGMADGGSAASGARSTHGAQASGTSSAPAANEGAASGTNSSSAGSTKPSRPVQIAGIEIRDGTIDYVDDATGQQATLSNVELDVGEWRADHPLPVHTKFLAHTQTLPPNGVWVELNAPELAIRPTPLSVTAPKLTLKVANAQAEGDLTYEQSATNVRGHGSVTLHSPSLRDLATSLALNQTLPHDPTTLGPLELTTTWSYNGGSVTANPLSLKLDGVSFTGWLQRSAPPKSMWSFELHGDRIDLGRYVNIDSKNKKPFELPVEPLRAINANGNLIFDQVVLADTHLSDVRLKLQTPEGTP